MLVETIYLENNLRLEILGAKHLRPVFELIDKNRAMLREWFPWVDNMPSAPFFHNFIMDSDAKIKAGTAYAFVIYHENEPIGRTGVYFIDKQNKVGSIGYWIDIDFQGRGIATVTTKAMMAYGFKDLNLNRIEIKCRTNNLISQAIPKKLGFRQEALLKQAEFINETYNDMILFAMVKEEWNENTY